jgi:hypothetical protein
MVVTRDLAGDLVLLEGLWGGGLRVVLLRFLIAIHDVVEIDRF